MRIRVRLHNANEQDPASVGPMQNDMHTGSESGSFLRQVQAAVRTQGAAGSGSGKRPRSDPSFREPPDSSLWLVLALSATLIGSVVGWALWPSPATRSESRLEPSLVSGGAASQGASGESAGTPTPVESAEAPLSAPLVVLPPSSRAAARPAPPVVSAQSLPAPVVAPASPVVAKGAVAKGEGQGTAERPKAPTAAPKAPASRRLSKPASKPKPAAPAKKAKKKVKRRKKKQDTDSIAPPARPEPAPFWNGGRGGHFLSSY